MASEIGARGVGERFDAVARETGEAWRKVEVRLTDGSVIETEIELPAADLAALQSRLTSDTFVQLGDTVIRANEVRAIQIKGSGLSTTGRIRSFISGGDEDMETSERGTYDRNRTETITARPMGMQRRGWADRDWGETKGSPKTTELFAYLLTVLAVAICTAVFDNLNVWQGLILITALTGAYLFSRGFAKSGTRYEGSRD